MNRIGDRRYRLRALSWMFGATALVAACGGNEGPAPAPAVGAPAPGAAPAPSPTPGPAPAPAPAPIAQTPAGDPEGLPTFATIGAAGGTLTSSDSRLTITVPAGALSTDTEVGIQPITATAPGALGSGYRLTPDGTTFAAPVTLTFKYSADEAAAMIEPLLRVATHDASGHWNVPSATHNAAQRALSVTTTHFSDWSFVGGVQIVPASAAVMVKKELPLRVVDCGEAPDPSDATAPPVLRECNSVLVDTTPWSVNGVSNGNASVGTMRNLNSVGVYTAPVTVPAQNPVAVSTDLLAISGLPTLPPGRTTLVSNVRVLDHVRVYEGTIFGGYTIRVQDQEEYADLSANVRFTHNPALSVGGDLWYDGSGTAHVRGRPFGCSAGAGTAAIEGAQLTLHTEGPLAGTYTLSAFARPTVTLTCGNPPQPLPVPLIGGVAAGASDPCPEVQIGDDPGHLAGSWHCNGDPQSLRANWTLRAVE